MTKLEEAKELLKNSFKSQLRDHYFGDREIYWEDGNGNSIAEGYAGSSGIEVSVNFPNGDTHCFTDNDAEELDKVNCKIKAIERNDSTGPAQYKGR